MLGFRDLFIKLIMSYVRTTSFSILINGVPKGFINHGWGLKQGDPLSPYIFLLCIEDLIELLKRAVANHYVREVKICRKNPSINHLLFAYNCIIFCQANMKTNRRVQEIFYELTLFQGRRLILKS